MTKKIKNWDEYFMELAKATSLKSDDPHTKVGSVIVNKNNSIVSIGWNAYSPRVPKKYHIWLGRGTEWIKSKYPYVIHSEMDAMVSALNKNTNIKGCKIYVTLFPCNECAKNLAHAGIKEVIYLDDKYHDEPIFIASRRILEMSGVKFRQYKSKKELK